MAKRDDTELNMAHRMRLTDDQRWAMDVGTSLGYSQASMEAHAAQQAGELDLWLEYTSPKTAEQWEAWREKHNVPQDGVYSYADRWH